MSLSNSKLLEAQKLGKKFINFLNSTGSPYHSVKEMINYMSNHNITYTHLKENDSWKLDNGKTYCVSNNNGTMMSFNIGKSFNPQKGGLILVCTHTDSPCLKLDSKCHTKNKGFNQLSVTTYGGGLWHTWMDRDLGLAGKVVVRSNDSLVEKLVHIKKPLFVLPNLAIHLQTREEREAFKLNKDTHLKPLVSTELANKLTSETEPLLKVLSSELSCKPEDLVDYDLCLMDSNPSCLSGLYEEFVSSPRLDNLGSCFGAVAAFTDFVLKQGEDNDVVVVMVAYNYEEIGSELSHGADSNVTFLWLDKLFASLGSSFVETRNRALIVSADMAHGVHPNYDNKHIPTHSPLFHEGVVVKWNVNGKYGTDLQAASLLKESARRSGVQLQVFRVGNESPCGTSVGPMMSSRLCIPVVDIGYVQLAMHSCREVASVVDLLHFKQLLEELFKTPSLLDSYKLHNH